MKLYLSSFVQTIDEGIALCIIVYYYFALIFVSICAGAMLTGSSAELRYTFHWIYVGILDTVTTVTIQLFGSHGPFVLIGAPWAIDRAYICHRKRWQRTQSSVWYASQAPPRFVEPERSIEGARPARREAKVKLCLNPIFISRSDAHTRGGWLATLGNRAPCSSRWPSTERLEQHPWTFMMVSRYKQSSKLQKKRWSLACARSLSCLGGMLRPGLLLYGIWLEGGSRRFIMNIMHKFTWSKAVS